MTHPPAYNITLRMFVRRNDSTSYVGANHGKTLLVHTLDHCDSDEDPGTCLGWEMFDLIIPSAQVAIRLVIRPHFCKSDRFRHSLWIYVVFQFLVSSKIHFYGKSAVFGLCH